jgi:hypothetical protein
MTLLGSGSATCPFKSRGVLGLSIFLYVVLRPVVPWAGVGQTRLAVSPFVRKPTKAHLRSCSAIYILSFILYTYMFRSFLWQSSGCPSVSAFKYSTISPIFSLFRMLQFLWRPGIVSSNGGLNKVICAALIFWASLFFMVQKWPRKLHIHNSGSFRRSAFPCGGFH